MRHRTIGAAMVALTTVGLGAPHPTQAPVGPSAAALLEAARTAMGGDVQLAAVKSLLLKGDEKVVSENLDLKTGRASTTYPTRPVEVRVILPDRFLQTVEVQIGSQPAQQSFFGFSGPELLCNCYKRPEALDVYRQTFAELMLLLLLRTDTVMPLTLRNGPVSGATLELTGGKDVHGYLDLDPTTHLPQRLRFRRPDRTRILELTGTVSDVVVSVDDYKTVGGIRLPSHLSEKVNGELFTDTRYATIQINPPLTAAEFRK